MKRKVTTSEIIAAKNAAAAREFLCGKQQSDIPLRLDTAYERALLMEARYRHADTVALFHEAKAYIKGRVTVTSRAMSIAILAARDAGLKFTAPAVPEPLPDRTEQLWENTCLEDRRRTRGARD
jgi:ankyrin repeat protein